MNWHKKVPIIAPELLFLINGIYCGDKMAILWFFFINQITLFHASTSMYLWYNQLFLNFAIVANTYTNLLFSHFLVVFYDKEISHLGQFKKLPISYLWRLQEKKV